ncbi:dihydrolipoyl dehydrogenase [Roseospira marina]|uniref:Dihydrolipoyl dehydrogenase n=1 Tax=Roseospira marina TaxID=140057 RepID=A0A5M6IE69_9PROT|nr:dihydrolipoyl dehydrogenase [Roseospira marina]KAA5606543.1 dihydrolipoyl dehydrogenase [Roseospira marina]MBB4314028.1 dihydrolipoamide dehydrogenase [Roseospira marina]MBB5087189.1 dihydrolipoamide dehydrogenase [Roseospira marina]
MSDNPYDLVVIGGGPGGYVCAIRAAQLGMKVACVDMRKTLGGTCLNVGCIPSKALLHSSHLFAEAKHGAADHGIKITGTVKADLAAMMARKDSVVKANVDGIAYLFKKHKIDWISGMGRIDAAGEVGVALHDGGDMTLVTDAIVLATGSEVAALPGVELDGRMIVDSAGALALPKVPKRMTVIGAGVIGLELGSVWSRLGAEVTVIEYLDHVLPNMDAEVRKHTQRILKKQGLTFRLSTKVTEAKKTSKGVSLTVEPAAGGEPETLVSDVVLVAIGRAPHSLGLGLDKNGIERTERGFIKVDERYQTTAKGIYAIGDVIGGMMLAHKAEEEGVAVAEILAGQAGHVNYDAIPSVVYTWPEIAAVGKTEEQLKSAGTDYKVGSFPFTANGRARANNDTDGFVKILADARTDRVLGCHIIGPSAGDLIQEVVVGMEFGASAEDIFRASHAHPQLGESIKEAALAVHGRPLHL